MKSATFSFKKSGEKMSVSLVSGLTIAALMLQFFVPLAVNGASVGPKEGSSFTDDSGVGTQAWSNVSNAKSSNNSYATVSLGKDKISHYIKATDFGFSIPTGPGTTVIDGITVNIERKASIDDNSGGTKNYINDNIVKLVKNGSITGNSRASSSRWGIFDDSVDYGDSNDLWNTSWSAADINNSNFGVVISAKRNGNDSNSNTASVDAITITVDYTYTAPPVQSDPNPSLGQSCGLDIALVLDSSGSINSTELAQMKSAFGSFVSTLGATPSEFSVTEFDATATVRQAFTGNITLVNSAINSASSGGSTNWQDGLVKAQSTFDPRPLVPNLIIFSSDGNPNIPGDGSGFDQGALDAAITQANTIKTAGTRIITLGIGSDVAPAHLQAISSADAYYDSSDFATLATTLQTLATDLCGGTITVTKLIDADGDLQTTGDRTPGAGWHFNIAGHADATGLDGKSLAWEVTAGTYNVTEAVDSGYSLLDAFCTGATNNGAFSGTQISNIEVNSQDIVSCTFYNSPLPGSLTVYKHVINDFDGQAVASDFHIVVNDGNLGSFFGDESGTQVSVPAGTDYLVQENGAAGGYAVSYSDGCSGTMAADGSATCTITNTQIDPHADQGTLTVIKSVVNDNNGQAGPADYNLFVDQAPVLNGEVNYFDAGTYSVSESDGPSGYSASFSDDCDGNGNITIAAGQSYTCTITNDDIAPSLTLQKIVSGGDASASSWTLSAFLGDNTESAISGLGSVQSGSDFQAGTYTLSETGQVVNYTNSQEWFCEGTTVTQGNQITLGIGDSAACSITNTYVPPRTTGSLTICKYSDKGVIGQYEDGIDTPLAWDMTVIYPNDGGTLNTGTNGETGCATIEELPFGEYSITEAAQTDWARSYPAESDTQTATIDSQTSPTVYFLNYLQAEVELTKTVEPSSVQTGHNATFTLTVTNNGPADATNVIVTDALPSGLTYVSDAPSVGTYDNSTNLWTIGDLANGAVATLTIVVTVSGTDGQQIVNQASLTIDPNIDINSENNSASATVTVTVPGQGGGSTPASEPVISGGGGGGNGPIAQSDAYQDYLNQQAAAQAPAPAPAPGEVLGESTNVPSQVLPATGFDLKEGLALLALLVSLVGLAIVATKRPSFIGLN